MWHLGCPTSYLVRSAAHLQAEREINELEKVQLLRWLREELGSSKR